MSNTISICRKEVRRFFASPGAYVVLAGSGLLFGLGIVGPQGAMAPVFVLTGFMPDRGFLQQRTMLLVGLVRVVAVVLIPIYRGEAEPVD
jgi:hypothetical protein